MSEAATSLNSLEVLALPYVGQRNAQVGRASEEVRELWRWVSKKLVEGR